MKVQSHRRIASPAVEKGRVFFYEHTFYPRGLTLTAHQLDGRFVVNVWEGTGLEVQRFVSEKVFPSSRLDLLGPLIEALERARKKRWLKILFAPEYGAALWVMSEQIKISFLNLP